MHEYSIVEGQHLVNGLRQHVVRMSVFSFLHKTVALMSSVLLISAHLFLWMLVMSERWTSTQVLLVLPLVTVLLLTAVQWLWVWNFRDLNQRSKYITETVLTRAAHLTIASTPTTSDLFASHRILSTTHERPLLHLQHRQRVHACATLALALLTPLALCFLLERTLVPTLETQRSYCMAGVIVNALSSIWCMWVVVAVSSARVERSWVLKQDGSFHFEVPCLSSSVLPRALHSITDLTIIVSPDGEIRLNNLNSSTKPATKRVKLHVVT